MSSEFGRKYHTVAIVAVSSSQVEDVLKVKVPKQLDCPKHQEGEQILGISDSDLITVIVLSLLVSLLVMVLSAILCHKSKRSLELSPL